MTDSEEFPETEDLPAPDTDTVELEGRAEPGYDAPGVDIPWRLIAVLALVVIVAIFAVQNTQPVELRLFGWSWELPLVLIIVFTAAISVTAEAILGGLIRRRRRQRRQPGRNGL